LHLSWVAVFWPADVFFCAAVILSFNPEPGTDVNSVGPTPAGRRIALRVATARDSLFGKAYRRDREQARTRPESWPASPQAQG